MESISLTTLDEGIAQYNAGHYFAARKTLLRILQDENADLQSRATAARHVAYMYQRGFLRIALTDEKAERDHERSERVEVRLAEVFNKIACSAVSHTEETTIKKEASIKLGKQFFESGQYEKARLCFKTVAGGRFSPSDQRIAFLYLSKIHSEGRGCPRNIEAALTCIKQTASVNPSDTSGKGQPDKPVSAATAPSSKGEEAEKASPEEQVFIHELISCCAQWQARLAQSQQGLDKSNKSSPIRMTKDARRREISWLVEQATIIALLFSCFEAPIRNAVAKSCPILGKLNGDFSKEGASVESLDTVFNHAITDITPFVKPAAYALIRTAMRTFRAGDIGNDLLEAFFCLHCSLEPEEEVAKGFRNLDLNKETILDAATVLMNRVFAKIWQTPYMVNREHLTQQITHYKLLMAAKPGDVIGDAPASEETRANLSDYILVEYERLDDAERAAIDGHFAAEGISLESLRNRSKNLVDLLERINRLAQGKSKDIKSAIRTVLRRCQDFFANRNTHHVLFYSSFFLLVEKSVLATQEQARWAEIKRKTAASTDQQPKPVVKAPISGEEKPKEASSKSHPDVVTAVEAPSAREEEKGNDDVIRWLFELSTLMEELSKEKGMSQHEFDVICMRLLEKAYDDNTAYCVLEDEEFVARLSDAHMKRLISIVKKSEDRYLLATLRAILGANAFSEIVSTRKDLKNLVANPASIRIDLRFNLSEEQKDTLMTFVHLRQAKAERISEFIKAHKK